ncbi:hypothetical protein ACH50O_00680 [Methylomonas sp. 2BW1-5-20]|uniref:hypothetical protein n=1 Tax=Methylomonas sp. 2BW1-5-20 TaxID=3376686 RepID=UPI00404E7686
MGKSATRNRLANNVATADYGELVAIEADQVVTGEMAGCSPVEAIPVLFDVFDAKPLPVGYGAEMAGEGRGKSLSMYSVI